MVFQRHSRSVRESFVTMNRPVRQGRLHRRVMCWCALPAFALVLSASGARAQSGGDGFMFRPPTVSFAFRLGYSQAAAGSDLFGFVTDQLTLDKSSFGAAALSGDFGIRLTPRFDLVLGLGYSKSKNASEFRNLVDQNNQPITQQTEFRRVPATASVKWYALPRGQSIGRLAWIPSRYVPFVGAGAGLTWYRFKQEGDFVDFTTMNVYPDTYESSGSALGVHAFGGLDVSLSPHVALTTELRYAYARAPLEEDYLGFEKLDLSGLSATAGLSFRF